MNTVFKLCIENSGNSSWQACASTLLGAHKEMQHMVKEWAHCTIARFEMIEVCACCNGAGEIIKSIISRKLTTKTIKCPMCKGINSQTVLIDYRPLDIILATSAKYIEAGEYRQRIELKLAV